MAFKRALWTSGLTYRITCPNCRTVTDYTDKQLDFRPWFPDGFIYCPRCKKPLRHNEIYAIDRGGEPVYDNLAEARQSIKDGYYSAIGVDPQAAAPSGRGFCTECGREYVRGRDRFCSGCGKRLD